jgi:hypothetical protein
LCLYSSFAGPQQGYRLSEILADPLAYTGVSLTLAYAKVVHLVPHQFRVENWEEAQIAVRIPDPLEAVWKQWREQLQVGHYVSLRAVVQPEGYLLLDDMHIHQGRRLKVWVSVLALLLLGGKLLHERRQVARPHA